MISRRKLFELLAAVPLARLFPKLRTMSFLNWKDPTLEPEILVDGGYLVPPDFAEEVRSGYARAADQWGTVTHWRLYDSRTGGELIASWTDEEVDRFGIRRALEENDVVGVHLELSTDPEGRVDGGEED